jgi:hypothetical protein
LEMVFGVWLARRKPVLGSSSAIWIPVEIVLEGSV